MFFPKSTPAPPVARDVVRVFEEAQPQITSDTHELGSNAVLAIVREGLERAGFTVETGKKTAEKIHVPVLFGENGEVDKAFDADAWHRDKRMVLEIEAGRALVNNQFLKDLFQACLMHGVDYCGVAVRNVYSGSKDFDLVVRFLETLYASNRLPLPLKGVLIVGY
jgi:hypothetical protein